MNMKDFLGLNDFIGSDSNLQGVVRAEVTADGIRYFPALGGAVGGYTSFAEAQARAKEAGVTEVRQTSRSGLGRLKAVTNQRLRSLQEVAGSDHLVQSMTVELKRHTDIASYLGENQGIIVDDGNNLRIIRVLNKQTGRAIAQSDLEGLVKKAKLKGLFELDESGDPIGKWGKRAKGLVSPRQIDVNRPTRIGVFDPNKLSSSTLERIGLGDDFVTEMQGVVDVHDKESARNALRNLVGEKEYESKYKDVTDFGSLKRSLHKELVTQGRKKALDGSGLVSMSAVEDMKRRLQEIAENPALDLEERRAARSAMKQIEDIKVGSVFNARFAGEIVSDSSIASGILGDFSDKAFTGKANLMVADEGAMLAAAGGEKVDILVSNSNINEGVGLDRNGMFRDTDGKLRKLGYLTAESQKASLNPRIDIISAVQKGLITEEDVKRATAEIGLIGKEIERLSEGKSLDPNSRAYGAIEETLESRMESQKNPLDAARARRLLDKVKKGEKLTPNQLSMISEMVVDSLTRSKNGTLYPQGRLTHGMSHPVFSEAQVRLAGGLEGVSRLSELETTSLKNLRVIGNVAASTRSMAHGGFDFDDKFNVIYRRGENGQVMAVAYRQPNAANEVSAFLVKDKYESEGVRRLAMNWFNSQNDAEMLKENIRKSIISQGVEHPSEVKSMLDWEIIDRYVNELDQFDGEIVSRGFNVDRGKITFAGLPEMTDQGVRYPGTEALLGKDGRYTFNLLGDIGDPSEMPGTLRALDRARGAAENGGTLGRWINARAGLDEFVARNQEVLTGILQNPEDARYGRVASLLTRIAEQETIIDIVVGNRLGDGGHAEMIGSRADELWETMAELLKEGEGEFQVDRFYFETKAPSGIVAQLQTVEDKVYAEGTYTKLNEAVEDARTAADEVVAGYRADNPLLKHQISGAAEARARDIEAAITEIGREHPGSQALQKQVLRDAFADTYDNQGRFGAKAAETYAALLRTGLSPKILGELASVEDAALAVLGGQAPEEIESVFDLFKGMTNRTSEYDSYVREIFGGDLVDNLAELPGRVVELGTQARILVDDSGRISPLSVVDVGDGEYAQIGRLLSERMGTDDLSLGRNVDAGSILHSGEHKSLLGHAEEIYKIREASAEALEQFAPEDLAEVENMESLNLKKGNFRENIRKALNTKGGLFGEGGFNLKKSAAVAAVGLAATMVYNSKRDSDFSNERMLNEGLESASPYDRGLTMTGPNATITRSPTDQNVSYRIRTRGGKFGDEFLSEVGAITGSAVNSSSYLDGLKTDRDNVIRDILMGF